MNLFWQIHQALGFWHIMTLFESLTLLIYCGWQRVFNIIFSVMSSINDFMTGEASTLTSSPGTWNITKHHHGNSRVSGPCFAGWSMEPYNPVSWWMRRVSQGSLDGSHFVRGTNLILDGAGVFFSGISVSEIQRIFWGITQVEILAWTYKKDTVYIYILYKFVHASRN